MKAVVYTKYGAPEVLQIKEVAKPVPKDNEVLIKVYSTTVTAADTLMRMGDTFISRIFLGMSRPRREILGTELAGEIESAGKDVKLFTKGDQVFGFTGFRLGAYAEYCCMPEKGSLAIMPSGTSYEEAAAVVDGASTALFFLRDKADIQIRLVAGSACRPLVQPRQKVLIIGASGSIGTFAVQLAKYFGAEVTGVCSTGNAELVKSLGADNVIDYTKEDFTQRGETYDIIFDTVGKSSFTRCKNSLKKNGRYLLTKASLIHYILMLWTSVFGGRKVLCGMSIEKTESLNFIRELIEAGKLKSVIDKYYPMDQVADAHRYVDGRHKKGSVIITVEHNDRTCESSSAEGGVFMKAIALTKYGPPENLHLKEMEKPVPKDDEVLVRVHASSVNYNILVYVTGKPLLARLMGTGFLKPKCLIPGGDISGYVEATGRKVTQFQAGDEVFGNIDKCGYGAYAEYVCTPEDALVIKPANISFGEAAAVPQAALVALQALCDEGRIQKGQVSGSACCPLMQPGKKVLIYGASGGIGTFAVQIAKSFGAEVTGVCSTRNLELVRSIGADHVIDYTQEDFTQNGQLYDLIIATAGYRSIFDYERALSPNGIYVATGGSMKGPKAMAQIFQASILGPRISKKGNKKLGILSLKTEQKDLVFLKELIEAGKVKPVIDRHYKLNEVSEALRYYEGGHARGKVVITILE